MNQPNVRGAQRQRQTATAVETTKQQLDHMIQEWPASSMLTAFGVGFGMGVVLGVIMAEPTRHEASTAERMGRSVLDAIARVLPESLSGRTT